MAPASTTTPSTDGSAASTATPTTTTTPTAANPSPNPNSTSNPSPDQSAATSTPPTTTAATATTAITTVGTTSTTENNAANFPPPKTDRPRPHMCGTCGRGFARLEHLKRHERSHTKEKPFECPQCSRCFARRDLLLRHQQKLHKAGETTKTKGGRRESASGPANGVTKARKGSTASSVGGAVSMAMNNVRPRANTISGFNGFVAANPEAFHVQQHQQGPPFSFRTTQNNMSSQGVHGLPKLNTQLGMHLGGGLQTAPPMQMGFGNPFDLENYVHDTTINPAQLHFPNGFVQQNQGFHHFGGYNQMPIEEDDHMNSFLSPLNTSFDQSLILGGPGPVEHAIDESSPSAISNDTQSGFSDVMADGAHNMHQTTMEWQRSMTAATTMANTTYNLAPAIASFAPELNQLPGMAPNDGHENVGLNDFQLPSAHIIQPMSPMNGYLGMHNQHFPLGPYSSDSNSMSSSPMNGSARQSSVTSTSSDTITETTRTAIMMTLSQAHNHANAPRRYSQPAISSPLSGSGLRSSSNPPVALPLTQNLQRYVQAYIRYFHPHLPFLHIPTLNFDSLALNSPMHNMSSGQEGGGGCLILAMACIGALYEYEHKVASDLFDSSKKLMMFYLDERRRGGLSAAQNQAQGPETPLWLVQAMLLNLVYGHNCGDRQAAEVATTHCAALVSLTKAAELDRPSANFAHDSADYDFNGMLDDRQNSLWLRWKIEEERKRTMFAVFVLSSLLVTAYAHHPRILNSEIKLRLPCDEDLWSAANSLEWASRGGITRAREKAVPFSDALGYLLNASSRQSETRAYLQPFGVNDMPDHTLQPSTFGCAILINALHVYIWETRQRHASRQWKDQETDAMIRQVEPALKAWQMAWRSHPHHTLARPNPYGPLGADCIPLLDCAYVRLFVDIGRTKDAIWERDFDKMADELAQGLDVIQGTTGNAEDINMGNSLSSNLAQGTQPDLDIDAIGEPNPDHIDVLNTTNGPPITKRERLLRRAANYAADSLKMADDLGLTFADFNSRELPLQSAMCTFECAQVLAEWSATVQERVGADMGILGRDGVEHDEGPAISHLEEKDLKLLKDIQEILQQANKKLSSMENSGTDNHDLLAGLSNYCYGSKLLILAASMLEKAGVWPVVTKVMSQALFSHAEHMQQRAELSVRSFRSS